VNLSPALDVSCLDIDDFDMLMSLWYIFARFRAALFQSVPMFSTAHCAAAPFSAVQEK
jgi:hypothetical protein